MNKKVFVLGMVLAASGALAQGMPDEINHPPYYHAYVQVKDELEQAQGELESAKGQLEAVLKAISDQNNYISTLEGQISEYEQRIAYIRNEVPAKERQIQDAQSAMRRTESEMQYTGSLVKRERHLLRREQRDLMPLNRELTQLSRVLDKERKELRRLRKEMKGYRDAQHAASNKVQSLRRENAALVKRMKDLQDREGRLEAALKNLDKNFSDAQDELKVAAKRVNGASKAAEAAREKFVAERAEHARLRRTRAPRHEVLQQARKVAEAKKAMGGANKRVAVLQRQKNAAAVKVRNLKRAKLQSENALKAIPGQIAKTKQDIKRNREDIKKEDALAARNEAQANKLEPELAKQEKQTSRAARRYRRTEREADAIQARIRDIAHRLRELEDTYARQSGYISSLSEEIYQLDNDIRNMNDELPGLERNIAASTADVSRARTSIYDLENEQSKVRAKISDFESNVASLENETEDALSEYSRRKELYESYLSRSRELGADQSGPAQALGSDEGSAIASRVSAELGQRYGNAEGLAQARLTGYVRGEIDGYHSGYDLGASSQSSVQEGRREGLAKGEVAAYQYVRTNLKPGYFEGYMRELLKMSVDGRRKSNNTPLAMMAPASAQAINMVAAQTLVNSAGIPDVSSSELSESRSLSTPMDSRIELAVVESKKLAEQFEQFQNPELAYDAPNSVPYTYVDCSGVYKGVAEYVSACESSFRSAFKAKYMAASYSAFATEYPERFVDVYKTAESSAREAAYQKEYDTSQKVAAAAGEVVGKKDAYDQAYALAYETSYSTNLPKAKNVADMEARRESHEWIESNPVLTVKVSKIAESSLRGGSKGTLVVELKNIASAPSLASGTLAIKSSENANFAQQVVKLPKVGAKSSSVLKVPFTVSTSARSGQKVRVLAELNLPGDKYKASRVEKVEVSQALAVNPAFNMDAQYDATPRIRGVFSTYVHTLSAVISPALEDLGAGYEVRLSVDSSQQRHVQLKGTVLNTKALKRGQSAKLDFSYAFNRSADNQVIKLRLETFYKGQRVGEKSVEVRPH